MSIKSTSLPGKLNNVHPVHPRTRHHDLSWHQSCNNMQENNMEVLIKSKSKQSTSPPVEMYTQGCPTTIGTLLSEVNSPKTRLHGQNPSLTPPGLIHVSKPPQSIDPPKSIGYQTECILTTNSLFPWCFIHRTSAPQTKGPGQPCTPIKIRTLPANSSVAPSAHQHIHQQPRHSWAEWSTNFNDMQSQDTTVPIKRLTFQSSTIAPMNIIWLLSNVFNQV